MERCRRWMRHLATGASDCCPPPIRRWAPRTPRQQQRRLESILQTHWFYTVWPFIGVGGAIVMVAILLVTDTFRGNTMTSRWRDPVWLAWIAVPLYWIHQFEEYSLP